MNDNLPCSKPIAQPGRPAPHVARRTQDAGRRVARVRAARASARPAATCGSNLGTVELTVALHYVFDTPYDRAGLGRRPPDLPAQDADRPARAHAHLRQLGGISGFPRRDESEYDTFGTAHSSTSISAALGMALAAKLKGEDRKRGGRHRRRRDERRHGLRGAEQRRRRACRRAGRHAGGAERQRHVDQPAGGRAEQATWRG